LGNVVVLLWIQAGYAEFLLKIKLQFLLRKAGARLILKMDLLSLHISPGISFTGNDPAFLDTINHFFFSK
jgi:hypothetical protein